MSNAPSGYKGHPNIPDLTAITPRITATRATISICGDDEVAMNFIQFTASDTTWTGPSTAGQPTFESGGTSGPFRYPYADLEFRWSCPTLDGKLLPHPVGQATQGTGFPLEFDPATDQIGPAAALRFDQIGDHPITLTARGWNGSEMIEASTTLILVNTEYHITNRATAGTFTLTVEGQTTDPIPWDTVGKDLIPFIEALSTVGAGNVRTMKYGMFRRQGVSFEFCGAMAGTPVTVTADFSDLSGAPNPPELQLRQTGETVNHVTVAEWIGDTRYIDFEAAAGGDGSIETPFNDVEPALDWFREGGNRRLLFKRGGTYPFPSQGAFINFESVSNSGGRIGAYGEGDAPVLVRSGSSVNRALGFQPTWQEHFEDYVVADVTWDAGGFGVAFQTGWTGVQSGRRSPTLRHFYFDNCQYQNSTSSAIDIDVNNEHDEWFSRWGWWNCRIEHREDATEQGMKAKHAHSKFIMGGHFAGGSGDPVRDHHIYPQTLDHVLYAYIDYREASGEKNFCIRNNTPPLGDEGHMTAEHNVTVGCKLFGTRNGISYGNSGNNPSQSTIDKILIQDCLFLAIPENGPGWGQIGMQGPCATRMTIRDNIWVNFDHVLNTITRRTAPVSAYRNHLVLPEGHHRGYFRATNSEVGQVQIFDNIVIRTDGGRIVSEPWTDLAEFAHEIDRNTYHALAGSLVYRDTDTATDHDFAAWQGTGYDPAGAEADPGWADPINLNFATGPATAYSLSIVSEVEAGASVPITLSANGDADGIEVTLSASAGSVNPNPVVFSGAIGSTTYTAPVSPGDVTISATNDGGLDDPDPILVTVVEAEEPGNGNGDPTETRYLVLRIQG